MKRKAFTLLELLLANVLIAILLGALLLVISSLAREQKRMSIAQEETPSTSIINLLRRDLSNSEAVRFLPNQRGFILTGHASLDARTLTPTDRRVRVIYEIRRRAGILCLIREQTYLDDPIKPQRFEQLIATHITSLTLAAQDAAPVDEEELNLDDTAAFTLPAFVTIHLGLPHRAIDQQLVLH